MEFNHKGKKRQATGEPDVNIVNRQDGSRVATFRGRPATVARPDNCQTHDSRKKSQSPTKTSSTKTPFGQVDKSRLYRVSPMKIGRSDQDESSSGTSETSVKRLKRSETESGANEAASSGNSGEPEMSTLFASSLNTPETTLKTLYVTDQQRYVIVQRISKVAGKTGVRVTYKIKKENGNEMKSLVLKDLWAELDWLEPQSLVNIVGVTADENDCFTVERLKGFLILEPDRLMSVTNIISQLYCERKAAFSRCYMGGDNEVMFRGVVAHELICRAMEFQLESKEDLEKEVKRICMTSQMLDRAYGLRLSDEKFETMQTDVVVWVRRFMKEGYFKGGKSADKKHKDFGFRKVLGIEDTIWNPIFGMKGKIDATILVEKDAQQKVVPLEFKTGSTKSQKRQSIKGDHVGQVLLYTLMMDKKYGKIDEAFLYYISDGSMSNHTSKILELQQLVRSRNVLVRNLKLSQGKQLHLPRPAGIDFEFKCQNCEVKNMCTMEIRKKNMPADELLDTEKKLLDSCKLTDAEFKFFEDWLLVINAETEEVEKKFNDHTIWTVEPVERAKTGTCLHNLQLKSTSKPESSIGGKVEYLASFANPSEGGLSMLDSQLRVDDFVVLSSNVEICINYGVVVLIRADEITLSFDQALHKEYMTSNFKYSIDKINSSSPIASQYAYLTKLMEDTPHAARLRSLIIDRAQPRFKKMFLPEPPLQEIVKTLNSEQSRVVMKSLVTDSFLFVKGVPGSGKTTTISRLLQAIVHNGKSVLVLTYTGTALETILLKYKKLGGDFIKISTSGRVERWLASSTTKELSKGARSIKDLETQYGKPVVGTTLLSLKHAIFKARHFDYCVIDEASQALPTAAFGALALSDRFIVFGDPHQLPAVLQSEFIKRQKVCDNFFSLMAAPVNLVKMSHQYRMNETIAKLANHLVYDNTMKCGTEDQKADVLHLSSKSVDTFLKRSVRSDVLHRIMCHTASKLVDKSVVFLDTSAVPAYECRIGDTLFNEGEWKIAMGMVYLFVESELDPTQLGIITPYRGQVRRFKAALDAAKDEKYKNVEVNTVDQYQGREMDVIICSFTKSASPLSRQYKQLKENSDAHKENILQDIRRLNVAITRAKLKLVLIGNQDTLELFEPFKKLFEAIDEVQRHCILPEEYEAFEKMFKDGVRSFPTGQDSDTETTEVEASDDTDDGVELD